MSMDTVGPSINAQNCEFLNSQSILMRNTYVKATSIDTTSIGMQSAA